MQCVLCTQLTCVLRLHNMESTMLSLATLPRAPPAALYNPLEHGHSLADNTVSTGHIYYILYII